MIPEDDIAPEEYEDILRRLESLEKITKDLHAGGDLTIGNIHALGLLTGTLRSGIGIKDTDLTGFQLDGDELVGQASGVDQVVLDADTGLLTAGAGVVTLDADGVSITHGQTAPHKISWDDGANTLAEMWTYDSGTTPTLFITAHEVDSGDVSELDLSALDDGDAYGARVTIQSNGYVNVTKGHLTLAADYDLILNAASQLQFGDSNTLVEEDGSSNLAFKDAVAPLGTYTLEQLAERGGVRIASDYASGSSTGGLAEAQTDLGASDGVIYLGPASYPIDDDLTILATTHLIFAKGASCAVANTKTLTINGTFEAKLYQIFDCLGTGTVLLPGAEEVYAQWWGFSTSANAADNTVAFAKAIIGAAPGNKIRITEGTFPINELAPGHREFVWEGNGWQCVLDYQGSSDFITIPGGWQYGQAVFRNFKITGNANAGHCFNIGGESVVWNPVWDGMFISGFSGSKSYTASTIAFVAATKKITDSGDGLAKFQTGDILIVSGSTSNDGTYTIDTGGVAGEIVVNEALSDESVGASVTAKSLSAGIYGTNIYNATVKGDTLILDCYDGIYFGDISMTFKVHDFWVRGFQRYGVAVVTLFSSDECFNGHVYDGIIDEATGAAAKTGVYISKGHIVEVDHIHFEGVTTGVHINNGINNAIRQNIFANDLTNAYVLDAAASGTLMGPNNRYLGGARTDDGTRTQFVYDDQYSVEGDGGASSSRTSWGVENAYPGWLLQKAGYGVDLLGRLLRCGGIGVGTDTPSSTWGAARFIEIEDASSVALVLHDTGQASDYAIGAASDYLAFVFGSTHLVRFHNDGGVKIPNLKAGANQAAAGAAADELWHDTDDNSIKIGV